MRIRDRDSSDPGSGMETVRIRDGKKSDPGSGINFPDPQHWTNPLQTRHPQAPLPALGLQAILRSYCGENKVQ